MKSNRTGFSNQHFPWKFTSSPPENWPKRPNKGRRIVFQPCWLSGVSTRCLTPKLPLVEPGHVPRFQGFETDLREVFWVMNGVVRLCGRQATNKNTRSELGLIFFQCESSMMSIRIPNEMSGCLTELSKGL